MPPVTRSATAPRIKRINDAAIYVGLSRSTAYRLLKLGLFPAPLKLSASSVGWDVDDLDAWLDAKKNEQSKHRREAQ
jgi:predicted DNA-binding transcriptional regulator AlpA